MQPADEMPKDGLIKLGKFSFRTDSRLVSIIRTIFPFLKMPNSGNPWILKESTSPKINMWQKKRCQRAETKLADFKANTISRKYWWTYYCSIDYHIPLSSCLSVSTLTNFISVNSSASAWKIGPTSCWSTCKIDWWTYCDIGMCSGCEKVEIYLAWTAPFGVEINYYRRWRRLLYDINIKLVNLAFYHVFQQCARSPERWKSGNTKCSRQPQECEQK